MNSLSMWMKLLNLLQLNLIVKCHRINGQLGSISDVRYRLGRVCIDNAGWVNTQGQNLVDFTLKKFNEIMKYQYLTSIS